MGAGLLLIERSGVSWSTLGRKQLLASLPSRQRMIVAAAFYAGWLVAVLSFLPSFMTGEPSGVPEIDGDRYVLHDHGEIIAVGQDEYQQAVLRQDRFFAGLALSLQAATAALVAAAARNQRASQ